MADQGQAAEVRQIWSALGLPGVIDVHTHFMPKSVLDKVWRYFDSAGPLIGRRKITRPMSTHRAHPRNDRLHAMPGGARRCVRPAVRDGPAAHLGNLERRPIHLPAATGGG